MHIIIIIIVTITRTTFMVLTSWLRVTAWVHLVHTMNAEQHQMDADLWTKPTDFSYRPACRQLYETTSTIAIYYYSDWKLISHRQRVEGWVDLDGWLHTQTVYLPVSSHPPKY